MGAWWRCGTIFSTLVLAAAGCDPGTPEARSADPAQPTAMELTRTDSAGVDIVGIPPSALENLPVWRLSDEPVLSIGEIEGEEPYLFAGIRGAVRLSDGRIVVLDASGELRFYDPDGRFLFQRGGEGDGPGEFREPRILDRAPGDTLYAWDSQLLRRTIFAPDGSLVETARLLACPPRDPDAMGGCVTGWPRFVDGGAVVTAYDPPRSELLESSGAVPGWAFPLGIVRDGEWTTVATLHQPGRFVVLLREEPRRLARLFPTMYAGTPVWDANGSWIAEARTDSADIRLRTADGTLRRILRFTGPPTPVTGADVDTYREAEGGPGSNSEAQQEARRTWLDEGPVAETMPRFGALRLDEAGRLWVRDYVPDPQRDSASTVWWTVFTTEGEPIARAELPAPGGQYQPRHIDEDLIVGSTIHRTLGVQRVVVHRIEWETRQVPSP